MRRLHSVTVFALISAFSPAAGGEAPTSGPAPATKGAVPAAAKKAAKPLIAISKETTYITGPLGPDGYVDYVAALNQRASKGVTPENNAAVPFLEAMGPGMVQQQCRDRYYRMLGIAPLPDKGPHFLSLEAYAKASKGAGGERQLFDQLVEQHDRALKRPWRKAELPLLAAWLEANKRPTELFMEASRRPRCYNPLISGSDGAAIGILLPAAQEARTAARTLIICAMQRLQEGKLDQAWADLLACHRLARLTGQGPFLIDFLVAVTIDGIACTADEALLQDPRLTAAQAAQMRADLAALPPLPRTIDKTDVSERFTYLDLVTLLARKGVSNLRTLAMCVGSPNQGTDALDSLLDDAARVTVDWNLVLRRGNKWYDRLVEAQSKPTCAERTKAYDKIDADLKKQCIAARNWNSFALLALADPRQAVSEEISDVLSGLLLPALSACSSAEDRGNTRLELTKLAFALAEYRGGHGFYPAKLADLVPNYVAAVPQDIFSGGALHYKPQGGGYLLYSVGPNGKDDGGRNQFDNPNDANLAGCDDIAVRIVPQR
jgi:hypothetical protein